MDSGDETLTFVLPFELFPCELGSGPADNQVTTTALGIKTKACHHNLLRELFSQLFTNPPSDIAHMQFTLSGIATIIGHAEYQTLLRENNKFFASLTTIPISGVKHSTLDVTVKVPNLTDSDKFLSLREILLNKEWCLQVEPTQITDKILLVTTKAQVSAGRKWVDDNFETLFRVHLPQNPNFQQSTAYLDVLIRSLPPTA